jgi:hypothetical protein
MYDIFNIYKSSSIFYFYLPRSILFIFVIQLYIYICREKVTVSVFILSGSQLKATWSVEGPIADLDVDSGLELYTKAMAFGSNGRKSKRTLSYSQEVDFEHLNEIDDDDDDDDVDDDDDDDDELSKPIDKDDPDADKKRRERRERQRKKFLDLKKKREEKKLSQLKKVRQDGEPILYTTNAPEAGWYRMCVTSNWNQVRGLYIYIYIYIFSIPYSNRFSVEKEKKNSLRHKLIFFFSSIVFFSIGRC